MRFGRTPMSPGQDDQVSEERLRVGYVAGALAGGGGMARYARELLKALALRDDVSFVVVAPREAEPYCADLPPGVVERFIPFSGWGAVGRAAWEIHRLGARLERLDLDVVHGMKHLVPKTRLPTVLTVHDVMAITWPQQFGLVKRMLLPRQYRDSLRAADLLLSDSNATAARLAALDPNFSSKTVVAGLGVAPHLLTVESARPSVVPEGPFALVVGDLSPRKNLMLLLDIWEEVAARTGGLRLVAVGPEGWRSKPTRSRIGDLAGSGVVTWAAHVSDRELRWCYENAAVVLMPTIEEGFGLPVVEALAFGAPVVASTDLALIEAAAGMARHVDVSFPDAWIKAIVEACEAGRTSLSGFQLPTWDMCAAETMEAYRLAITAHGKLSRG